jgi:2-keto-4-pentenoate hydratase/2-oxohepta-3-ene-1,7-dioic acid hydratase in catechol pathway
VRRVRFEHGGEVHDGVLEEVPDDARLLAPVTPGKIIAVGQNYMDHIREQGAEPPGIPVLFPKFTTCVIGPGDEIRWPASLTSRVDYEGELAVVIGERATRVPQEDALGVVAGYTVANDVSARDLQMGDGQWLRGKGLDTFLPLGPAVVTGLDYRVPGGLLVEGLVNGDVRQSATTSALIFSIDYLIAFVSAVMTLLPGDIIITGTPAGVGPLKAGDSVTVRIAGVGELTNPVA